MLNIVDLNIYVIKKKKKTHLIKCFGRWLPQTLQTLHNDSLTTVDRVHYIDDKGVGVCLTGC